jgi:hypothetical protein
MTAAAEADCFNSPTAGLKKACSTHEAKKWISAYTNCAKTLVTHEKKSGLGEEPLRDIETQLQSWNCLLGGAAAGCRAGAPLFAFLTALVMGFAFSGFLVRIGLGCFGSLLVSAAGLSE